MKKILVAGGSGFLGNYLINEFNKDFLTISLSRSESKKAKISIKCNFLNKKKLQEKLKTLRSHFGQIDCIIFTIGDSKKKKNDILNKFKTNFVTFKIFLNLYCKIYNFKPTKIIVISSVVTEKNFKDAPREYTFSKRALKNYAKKQSKRLSKKKININLISPGNLIIKGNNWSQRLKEDRINTMNYIKKNVPINKFIKPNIIYKTCKLLIDDKENFYTGSNFIIDGGQSL
jgi:NAD(P)-dependent dehydrogenase (short-subunit alcohol dehydrogenase family)